MLILLLSPLLGKRSLASAYIDTTVLTDILLKSGEPAKRACAALENFDGTQVPMYAIKEFKRGPLRNFAWMHNKFVMEGTFHGAIVALHAMSRTPKRYTTSTALESLIVGSSSLAHHTLSTWVDKHGSDAEIGNVLRDEMRLALKKRIYQAWSKRHSVATETVHPLSCYEERAPYEKRGLIELSPTSCEREQTCCLAPALRAMADDLRKMKDAIDASGSTRNEDRRRAKSLRQVYRTAKTDITDEVCRNLGDAVIVAFAPSGLPSFLKPVQKRL